MKKFLYFQTIIALLICLFASFSVNADSQISITVNGIFSNFPNVKPFIENGRTMVPVRFVSESLEAKVEWIPSVKLIIISKNNTKITLRENEDWAIVNILGISDSKFNLNNRVSFKYGKAFVPLRFIAEKLDAVIDWDSLTGSINLKSKEFITDASGSSAK